MKYVKRRMLRSGLPRQGLVGLWKTSTGLTDVIGLSISDAPLIDPNLWSIVYVLDGDGQPVSVRENADILARIAASPWLNISTLVGSAAKGYALYAIGSSADTLAKARRALSVPSIPWLSGYAHRKAVVVNHATVPADLSDYQLYVDLSSDNDIPAKVLSNGLDIAVTAADGTTVLGAEIPIVTQSTDNLTTDGVWCWYSEPRSIYYNGKTYTGFIRANGDVVVVSYNHATDAQVEFVLKLALQVDDHANPSILIRDDGRIVVFYCAHNGADMFYRVSTNPEDISAFDAELTVGTNTAGLYGYSYSNPCILSAENNKIFLFWRGGDFLPTFSTSTDGGATWDTAKTLFSVFGERPYLKVAYDGTSKIHLCFTDGHPDALANNSIYYLQYENGEFKKADGTVVKTLAAVLAGSPLVPTDCDKVYDSVATGFKAWNWGIAYDSSNYPVIVYANFVTAADHRYRYARWTDAGWADNEICAAGGALYAGEPSYSGGVSVDPSDPNIVYLSKVVDGQFEVYKYTTNDNGVSWERRCITVKSIQKQFRPIVAKNSPVDGQERVFWLNGTYSTFSSYSTIVNIFSLPTGPEELYAKLPILSSENNTKALIYYGKSGVESGNTTPWGTDYEFVCHMDNSNVENTVIDTSKNGYSGTKNSLLIIEVPGLVGKAQRFSGGNKYITFPALDMAGWGALIAGVAFKYNKQSSTAQYSIFSNYVAGKAAFMIRIATATNTVQGYVITTGGVVGGLFADVVLADAEEVAIHLKYDKDNGGLRMYKNGVLSATSYASTEALAAVASGNLTVGSSPHSLSVYAFYGDISDAFIIKGTRTADWFAVDAANKKTPTSLYTVGVEDAA